MQTLYFSTVDSNIKHNNKYRVEYMGMQNILKYARNKRKNDKKAEKHFLEENGVERIFTE